MSAKGSKFVPDPPKGKGKEKSTPTPREKFGAGHTPPEVKNPRDFTDAHLRERGFSGIPKMSYKDYRDVWGSENSILKNKDRARRSNKHTNADAKTSAYVPRPGDNMPTPDANHANKKKPSLVMRFVRARNWSYEWKDSKLWKPAYVWKESGEHTAWKIYESRWGYFRCEVWRGGKLVHRGFGKTAKDSVLEVLSQSWFFNRDAAQNFPLWRADEYEGVGKDKVKVRSYVSVFKTVHVLMEEKPKTPLPTKAVTESFCVKHMRGHFFWNAIERPVVKVESMYSNGVSTGAGFTGSETQMI